ncbi:hypothetical protein D7Z54_28705 [Salibacterium salarium]|uniref:Probable multidrug resistance protein NorM n=1 Tax=Salibacterium salarium TaxID=284579 RepID=A0A428MUW7_9BACI|nr:MATE family efflux transporter [Salibacterium salarium]RSL29920.1 hypothetical protein D7Z54_28705 [Salibacterium salarium]
MSKSLNFQQDNILPLIIKTSIPLILASTVTMIVQLANITFMGNVSATDIYIRSLYTPFAFLTISFTEAFQISNQVIIARLKGDEQYESIRKNIINFVFLSLIFSVLLAAVVYVSAPFIASYYQIPADISDLFISFLRTMFLVNSLVILSMVLTSALRGYGHVNISVILNIIYALLNILLVYYFAFPLEQGVMSIVYSNLISSIITSLATIIVLYKNKILLFKRKYLKYYKRSILFLKNIGLPISLSYLIIFISNFFFNKIVAPFGSEAVSGFGVAYTIQTFVIVPAIAIGSSLGIIMNSNIGGGIKYFSRVFNSYKTGVKFTISFYFTLTISIYIFQQSIVETMLENQTSINYASDFITIVAPSYLLMGVVLMTITTLEQINKGVTALILNAVYFAVITSMGWYLTRLFNDLTYFYWTFFTVSLFGIFCVIFTWKLLKKEYGST